MNICYTENDLLELYLVNPKDSSVLNFFNETTTLPTTFEYTYENQYETYQFLNYIQTSKSNPLAIMPISITAYVNDNLYLSKFFEDSDEFYLYININEIKYYTRVRLKNLKKEIRHRSRFVIVDITFDRLSNFIEEIHQSLPPILPPIQSLYNVAHYDIDVYGTNFESDYNGYQLTHTNASYIIKGIIIDADNPTIIYNSNDTFLSDYTTTFLNILEIPPITTSNPSLSLIYSNIPNNRLLTLGNENIIFSLPSYNVLNLFSNLIYKNIFIKNLTNVEITLFVDHKLI